MEEGKEEKIPWKVKKRTEGKLKNCSGPMDVFKYYVEKRGKGHAHYGEFAKIIREVNIERVIENAELVKLPMSFGYLQVVKRKFKGAKIEDYSINWKESHKNEFIVYFDSNFSYKPEWRFPSKKSITTKKNYRFLACRRFKRRIADALRRKKDFFGIQRIKEYK